jgi:hypothetical protein
MPDSEYAAATNAPPNPVSEEPPASVQAVLPADVHPEHPGSASRKASARQVRVQDEAQSAHPALDRPDEQSVVEPAPAHLEC